MVRDLAPAPQRLLADLDAEGIVYCHWKSNSHLSAALDGHTDLDLLFDNAQIGLVHRNLAESGYKRFVTHPSRAYPGMEDYLGVHPVTGTLVHLHVHYRLAIGQRHMKNYRLSWEDEVLGTRTLDPTGVFTAEPGHEWLLLVIRAAMKIRGRDRLRSLFGAKAVPAELVEEHRWLASRADKSLPGQIAADLLDEQTATLVSRCVDSDLGFGELLRLRRRLRQALKGQRAYDTLAANIVRARREMRWALGSVNRKSVRRPYPYARSPAGGGLVLALIGGDGSGKSTIANELYGWLEGKVDVLPIYFGSGKGRASWLRFPLDLMRKVLRRSRRATRGSDGTAVMSDEHGALVRAVWALVLAREKRLKIRKSIKARERGFIVICDRFPQTQVSGMIDGTLLDHWMSSESKLLRSLARWEADSYTLADTYPPDLVIRLDVTSETAASRRPEAHRPVLDHRRQVVESLMFKNARFGLRSLDANRDLDDVLLDVKHALWEAI
ncbi:MAG TPA: hypothetical protein VGB33_06430 [Acidimicrobiia bacterium]